MDKVIKKSFQIITKNSAIMQPLIWFIIFMLFFNTIMGAKSIANITNAGIFNFLTVLLQAAFLSGWMYMIKYAIDTYQIFDKNDKDYSLKIGIYNIETIKKFFTGVGEYFLPVICILVINIIFSHLVLYSGQKLLHISTFSLISQEINNNTQTLQALLKINPKEILFIFYFFGAAFIFSFLTLFWMPALFYTTKNPIKALFISIKFLFKHFFTAVGTFSFLFACYTVFAFLGGIASLIYILLLIFFFLFLYLISYSVVFIFATYKQELINETVEKVNSQDVFIKSSDILGADYKEDEKE